MKVLLDTDNVVVAKGDIVDAGDGSFELDNTVYGANLSLSLVETTLLDADITPQRDKIISNSKSANSNYSALENEKHNMRSTLMSNGKDNAIESYKTIDKTTNTVEALQARIDVLEDIVADLLGD